MTRAPSSSRLWITTSEPLMSSEERREMLTAEGLTNLLSRSVKHGEKLRVVWW